MEYVDGQLVAVRDRVSEARASSDSSRTDVLRSAFRGKREDGEESVGAKSAERKSQFKVVAKRDSAILPEHGHQCDVFSALKDEFVSKCACVLLVASRFGRSRI